jgi:hypothetical protein
MLGGVRMMLRPMAKVNTSGEASKGGVEPLAAAALCRFVQAECPGCVPFLPPTARSIAALLHRALHTSLPCDPEGKRKFCG